MKHKIAISIFSFFVFLSCKENESPVNGGAADFSKYIAVGNSLTAGYADGGLYRQAQLTSYPKLLATQLGTSFTQPLMPEGNGSGYAYLTSYSNGNASFNFLTEDPGAFNKVDGPFNNLGVPGIRVKDLSNPKYGKESHNPYFYRMIASGSEENFTYFDQLEGSDHTFFTCWMGNNDVLGYATDGGANGIDGIGSNNISGLTNVVEFEQNYKKLMDMLLVNDAKGVLITIPDIPLIPYFNLVSNDAFPPLNEAWLTNLETIYKDYNESIDKYNEEINGDETLSDSEKDALTRPKINFEMGGKNAFVIVDNDLPGDQLKNGDGKPLPKIRHLEEGEKVTLYGVLEMTDLSKLAGIQRPLEDRFVLTKKELGLIQEYRDKYNSIIRGYQSMEQVVIIEADGVLEPLVDGQMIDGVEISTQFVEGGMFSLDGVHLAPRGYALVTNEIIKAINTKFLASIEPIDISQYPGVEIP